VGIGSSVHHVQKSEIPLTDVVVGVRDLVKVHRFAKKGVAPNQRVVVQSDSSRHSSRGGTAVLVGIVIADLGSEDEPKTLCEM